MEHFRIMAFILALIFGLAHTGQGKQAGEALQGQIISVNKEYDITIVNLGKEHGIRQGTVLSIYRNRKKIGEAEVIKVKDSISGVDVREVLGNREVKAGDIVVIEEQPIAEEPKVVTKKPVMQRKVRPERVRQERVRPAEEEVEEEMAELIWAEEPVPLPAPLPAVPKAVTMGPVATEIDASKEAIFFLLTQTLKEYRFIITGSKESQGLLTAKKDLELSLAKEAWADIIGTTDHELLLFVKITPGASQFARLSIHADVGYRKDGQYREDPLAGGSPAHKEIREIAAKIKQRAE